MYLGNNTEDETLLFNNIVMENSKEQKIHSVIINNKLNFKSHINQLYKKASEKIIAFSRLCSYLHNSDKKIIFNSVIKSQNDWSFQNEKLTWSYNNGINFK